MEDIHKILQQYWGHSAFRPLQQAIIQSCIDGNDTLALLPTGGGKSVCFQVPAMAMDGLCVVVSPLIALMKDQVSALKNKGIPAVAMVSGMSARELNVALEYAQSGACKFLYLSPERLLNERVKDILSTTKICLIAVDEAHCISEWGHDFRPAYHQIAEARKWLPPAPMIALTATATTLVMNDICEQLQLKTPEIFQKSFARENLVYAVRTTDDKQAKLLEIVQKLPGTGIIYVRNRRETEQYARFLTAYKQNALFYHAGQNTEERARKQQDWMSDKVRIMVATNAFGMGIDKANVRWVIHTEAPPSPEAYFQEAGRGGRDGDKAYAILLWSENDRAQAEKKWAQNWPVLVEAQRIYTALGNYCQLPENTGAEASFAFDIVTFANNFGVKANATVASLHWFEKEGLVSFSENVFLPSRLMILAENSDLYKFRVDNPKYEGVLTAILRLYGGVFEEFVSIQEVEIARKTKLAESEVKKILRYLHQIEILHYQPKTDGPRVTWLQNRQSVFNPNMEHYTTLKDISWKKLNTMLEYAETKEHCRSRFLLYYFDEKNADDCGKCDYCLSQKSTGNVSRSIEKLKLAIQKNPNTSVDDLKLAVKMNESVFLEAMQQLVDEQYILLKNNVIVLL